MICREGREGTCINQMPSAAFFPFFSGGGGKKGIWKRKKNWPAKLSYHVHVHVVLHFNAKFIFDIRNMICSNV